MIDQRRLAYDRNQNKTSRTQLTEFSVGHGLLTNRWSYNSLNMMVGGIDCGAPCANTAYTLDSVGNRLMVTVDDVVQTFTRDSASPPADF